MAPADPAAPLSHLPAAELAAPKAPEAWAEVADLVFVQQEHHALPAAPELPPPGVHAP